MYVLVCASKTQTKLEAGYLHRLDVHRVESKKIGNGVIEIGKGRLIATFFFNAPNPNYGHVSHTPNIKSTMMCRNSKYRLKHEPIYITNKEFYHTEGSREDNEHQ
jgi:hypothetical protein